MCITSTLPSELMVTRPFAPEIQPAANAPAEGTMLKVVLCANALMLMKLSTRPVTNERLFFTVVFSPSKCFVFYIVLCAWLSYAIPCTGCYSKPEARPSPRPAGSATFPFSPAPEVQADHSHLAWVEHS